MERGLFPQTWDLSGVGCLISRLLEDSNKHSVPVRPDANSVCWCSELWEALGIVGNSREEARKGRGVRSRLPVPLLPFSCGITAPKRGCAFRLKEVKVPTYWTDLMAYKETGQSQANWCLEEDHGLSHQWGQHLQMATTLTIWKSDWVTLWQSHLTPLCLTCLAFPMGILRGSPWGSNEIMMIKLPVPWRCLADTCLFPLGLSQYRLTPCVLHLPLVYRKTLTSQVFLEFQRVNLIRRETMHNARNKQDKIIIV